MEALLIIDMLNDFVLPGAPLEVPATRSVIPVIRREIDKAHAAGRPVIYVCDAHDADDNEFRKFGWPAHAVQGTAGAGIVAELRPIKGDFVGDFVVRKKTYSSFLGTDLESTLQRLGADSLRLAGVVTHICILFTAYEGVLRNYPVTVVENGVAGILAEDHEAALRIMKNVLGVTLVRSEMEETGRIAA